MSGQHNRKILVLNCGGSRCAQQGNREMKIGLTVHKGWKEGLFVQKTGGLNIFGTLILLD